ncbi:B12-binding domain-containing radical SAM protein [bacterium]|nr:B12-binding domain-containing radical SAM protein [bacterium]
MDVNYNNTPQFILQIPDYAIIILKMRILLLKTYEEGFTLRYGPPLGLMYVASSIREAFGKGVEIEIIDPRPKKMGVEEISDIVFEKSPDIVGTSSLTCESAMLYKFVNRIKEDSPGTIIITGGPHGDSVPMEIMERSLADFVVTGEGEKTIVKLMRCLQNGTSVSDVKGIYYRSNGKAVMNPKRDFIEEVDKIPFPAWDLIRIEDYDKMGTHPFILKSKRWMPILTSRACPFQCTYCHNIFGKKPRLRSPENVIEELRILYETYKIREIQFMDDMFNIYPDRAKRICDLIIENNFKFNLCFPNGLRGDRIDEELVRKLKQAGTYFIAYAFESASERIQKMIKKRLDVEKTKKAVEFTSKYNILTYGFFMLGFPTETLEEIHETINLASSTKLHMATFPQVLPFPGTELFEQAVKLCPNFKMHFDTLDYETDESYYSLCYKVDLKKIQSVAYRKFYFNPVRLIKMFFLFPRRTVLFIQAFTLLRYFFRSWDKLSKKKA